MLKIIGIILIVAATTKIGFLFAARLERRKNALISFKDALSLLESEIGFAQNSLAKAFFNIGNTISRPVGAFSSTYTSGSCRAATRNVHGRKR